ncbi:hypothetical protein ACLB2K_034866 [Fragaria x ananassa]
MLDLTCQIVPHMIKGKTPEEIRKTFNINNDFTPEEEEEIGVRSDPAFPADSAGLRLRHRSKILPLLDAILHVLVSEVDSRWSVQIERHSEGSDPVFNPI